MQSAVAPAACSCSSASENSSMCAWKG